MKILSRLQRKVSNIEVGDVTDHQREETAEALRRLEQDVEASHRRLRLLQAEARTMHKNGKAE